MISKKTKTAAANVAATAKTETAKAISEITKAAEPMVEAVKEELKDVEADLNAEPVVAKAKAAAKKAEPAVKAATKAVKNTGKAIASALVPEIYVEHGDKKFTCTDIVDRCRADFKANNKGAVRSCQVYIKAEDGVAYYVINDVQGKINL